MPTVMVFHANKVAETHHQERDMPPIFRKASPPASSIRDKRPARRKRVLLGGVISYGDGKHSAICTIRDITDTGARIAVRGQQIPPGFYLINTRDRMVHEAKVIWNRGTEMGLSFSKSFRLSDITDPKLGYLTHVWMAQASR